MAPLSKNMQLTNVCIFCIFLLLILNNSSKFIISEVVGNSPESHKEKRKARKVRKDKQQGRSASRVLSMGFVKHDVICIVRGLHGTSLNGVWVARRLGCKAFGM